MIYNNNVANTSSNYIEVSLSAQPFSEEIADVVAAMLAPLGYDSFATEADVLKAYCPASQFSAEALDVFVGEFPLPEIKLLWTAKEVVTEDWNQEWEKSVMFEPIVVGEECCIHAPNAPEIPACRYDIVIAPKMSFGSGHHETTRMLLEEILLCGGKKTALDMGTGTGILAILCGMLGMNVRAIEIDPWVAENATDNVLLNNLAGKVRVECGDASLLGDGQSYDLILANINRNVLLNDMHAYVADLNAGGCLLLSGFYEEDLAMIRECAESLGLRFVSHRNTNNWVAARFILQG